MHDVNVVTALQLLELCTTKKRAMVMFLLCSNVALLEAQLAAPQASRNAQHFTHLMHL